MEKKMQRLEAIVASLTKDKADISSIETQQSSSEESSPSTSSEQETGQFRVDEAPTASGQTPGDIVMDLDSGPGAIPGFYISDTPSTESGDQHADFISRRSISVERAQEYFDKYKDRLDHFPYRILGDHGLVTLESVRATSPLLAAAVCTVGALHSASPDYDVCYREFVSLSAHQAFSPPRANTEDDVRALCIGAFWLSDLSWTLVSAAVRIATQLQLHKSLAKALQQSNNNNRSSDSDSRHHYLRARLYLLVYACDHQFSVAFGRPPMTRTCALVRNARHLLVASAQHATEDDARLVSQVLRWSVCADAFDAFGPADDDDSNAPLADADVPALRRFGAALDGLRAEWADRFQPSAHVGNYPRKGVGLQYHFAKLYLCSHAFRGAGSAAAAAARSQDVALELDEIANSAFLAALSILRAVVLDPEIQSYLNGLPIYFATMIAFAVVFLFKVSTRYPTSVQMNVIEVRWIIRKLVATLKKITSPMHPRHLLVSITKGIDSLVQDDGEGGSIIAASGTQDQAVINSALPDESLNWAADELVDPYFLGEYDFLSGHDMDLTLSFPQ
jgi:hypothetical protein